MSDQQPPLTFTDMFVVGITGHRDVGDAEVVAHIRHEAEQYFDMLSKQHANICVLSQLAVGADTILVESAQQFGAQHIVVIPFTRFEEDFTEDGDLSHYRELRNQALDTHHIDHEHRSDKAYFDAGKWIVEQAHAILAAWDGEEARGTGGTGDVVAYAQALQKPVFVIATPR